MTRNDKNLIERYFNGQVNGNDLVKINKLIVEDEEFRRRFEIRKASKEVTELRNSFHYSNQLETLLNNYKEKKLEEERKIEESKALKKRIRGFYIAFIAALIFVTVNIYYLFSRDMKDFESNVNYSEINYKGGTGFNGTGDSIKSIFVRKINVRFIGDKKHKDTIYQVLNADTLKLTFPKLSCILKNAKVSILHDYKLEATLLLINKDTFLIENKTTPQKLLKYRK